MPNFKRRNTKAKDKHMKKVLKPFIKKTINKMSEIKQTTLFTAITPFLPSIMSGAVGPVAIVSDVNPSISVGASATMRIGNKIFMESVRFGYSLHVDIGTGLTLVTPLIVRVVITQAPVALVAGGCLTNNGGASQIPNIFASTNKKVCKVIYDKLHYMEPYTSYMSVGMKTRKIPREVGFPKDASTAPNYFYQFHVLAGTVNASTIVNNLAVNTGFEFSWRDL